MKSSSNFPFVAGSAGLYVLSLLLPTFVCYGASMGGFRVLLMGWLGVIGLEFAWFANIPYFIMLIRVAKGRNNRNLFLPIAASGLALLGLSGGAGCGPDLGQVGDSLDVGGYLWVASILLISVCYVIKRPAAMARARA